MLIADDEQSVLSARAARLARFKALSLLKRQSQLSPNSEQPSCLDTDLAEVQPKHHCPNVAIPVCKVSARHMPHYHNDQQLLVNVQKSSVKLFTFSFCFQEVCPVLVIPMQLLSLGSACSSQGALKTTSTPSLVCMLWTW